MSYAITKSRILQWLGIILVLAVFAGAYWYFQVYGSTLNQSQNDLVTNGLVGLWSFNGDDISGTTAYDRSGSGNNGTLTGGPTAIKGKIGQAFSFDGSNDYMTEAAIDLSGTDKASIVLWLSQSSFRADDGLVFEATTDTGSATTGFYFNPNTNGGGSCPGLLSVLVKGNVGTNHACYTRPSTNDWHQYVVIIDKSQTVNEVELYIDGVLQTPTARPTTNNNTNNLGNDPWYLMSRAGTTLFNPGKIDDVRVYNRVLSAGEIQSLYGAGSGTKANTSISQPQGTGRLDSGLAGYWKMDDGSGTSATDSSTNGITGTLNGTSTWGTGQIGSSVTFDGTDDYITAGDRSEFEMSSTNSLSFGGWFKVAAYPSGNRGFLITKGGSAGSGPTYEYELNVNGSNSNKLRFAIYNDSGVSAYMYIDSTTVPALDTWFHVMAIWDAQDTAIKLYYNGALEATSTSTTSGIHTVKLSHFVIGKRDDDAESDHNGAADEVRVYSRALSADEVGQLYRLTTPTAVDTGLKGYWSFNGQDVSGTTAYDRSGAGNTGTLTNGPTKTIGKLGQAINFDGTDDYVTVTDASTLDITGAISMGVWVKTSDTDSCIMSKTVVSTGKCFEESGNKVYELGILSSVIYFQTSNGTTVNLLSGSATPIIDNNWHYLVATWDGTTGSNGMKLYLDGTVLYQATATVSTIQSTSSALTFGGDGGEYDYAGLLDEGRLYNRALSAAEIKGLYDVGADDKVNSAVSQPQGTGRLDSSLVGYWKLDDGTSGATPTTATDSSTNGNTGTLTLGPTWTTGQIGNAVDFDGSNDYITVPTSSALDVVDAENFTLSGWFNRDTFTGDHTIVAKRASLATGNNGYAAYIPGTGDKLSFEVSDGVDEYLLESVSTFTATGWHHYAVVWNESGASQTKLYIDGVAEAATATGTFANVNSLTNAKAFTGGMLSDGGSNFDGKLDEVRFYDRALSADEVSQLYRLGTPTGTDTGLKGYWSFNGQDMLSSTTAADRSGAGNTGTLTGGPTLSIGKIGQAINFDGTDDYVSVADNVALDFGDTADLTLSGWFYRDTFTTDDTVIAKRNSLTNTDAGYIAYIDDATDQLIFEISDGTDEYSLTSVATFTATGWNHYAIVWDQDSAANSEIYVNGVVNNATDAGTIGNIGDLSNAVVLAAGTESDAGNPFDGKLDEIRIYNRALSGSEIWSLYQSGGGLANTCKSSSVTDVDSNVYGTVNIGSQCWMKQNMRVGTRIAAAGNQTNNATTEKYCYSNSDANCTGNNPNQPDGGLYQWNEAMQYVTTAGAQGICPSGFHIPTDTEWYVLENHLKDAGQTCSASRSGTYDCSSAGTKLKPNGTSGFEGNLAGGAYSGSFFLRAAVGYFWSSSESGANAWYRYLSSSVATVGRVANDKTFGFSVRCLQDSP